MPQVRRFPIDEMHKVHMRDGYLLACGEETLKRTVMRPGHGGAECDELSFCEHCVNLEVQVRKVIPHPHVERVVQEEIGE